jgi:hypothetical protein
MLCSPKLLVPRRGRISAYVFATFYSLRRGVVRKLHPSSEEAVMREIIFALAFGLAVGAGVFVVASTVAPAVACSANDC